jgi:hypothetical protein
MKKISNSGFTIIEVMISVILLSFITIAVITNTNENFEITDRIVKEDKDMLKVYSALALMNWDFSQIYSPLYFSEKFNMDKLAISVQNREDPLYALRENLQRSINQKYRNNPLFYIPSADGTPIPRFKQPDKFTFEFFTTSNRRVIENSKVSNFSWVVYTLEAPTNEDIEYRKENGEESKQSFGSNLVRYQFSSNPFIDTDIDFKELSPQILMENVEKMEFTFWNTRKEKFTALKDIVDGQGWIQAIKVQIEYKDIYERPEKIEKIFRPLWPLYNPLNDDAPNANQASSIRRSQ